MLLRINQALHNQRCTIHSEAVRLQPHMLLNRGNAGEAVTRPQPFHKACATPMGWLGPTSVPNLNPSCDGAPPDLDYLADNVPYVSLEGLNYSPTLRFHPRGWSSCEPLRAGPSFSHRSVSCSRPGTRLSAGHHMLAFRVPVHPTLAVRTSGGTWLTRPGYGRKERSVAVMRACQVVRFIWWLRSTYTEPTEPSFSRSGLRRRSLPSGPRAGDLAPLGRERGVQPGGQCARDLRR